MIKRLYYNWRPRTAELLQQLTGHEDRLDRGYVVGVIREELGAFFRWPAAAAGQAKGKERKAEEETMAKYQDEALARIADKVVLMDRHVELSPWEWQFHFSDPATGQMSGFAYDSPVDHNPRVPYNRTMELHNGQTPNNAFAVGQPVDHIVRPMLLCYGLSRKTYTFDDLIVKWPLVVSVVMNLDYSGLSDHSEEDEEGEDGEGEESKGEEGGNQ